MIKTLPRAKDIMMRRPLTLKPDMRTKDAAAKLLKKGVFSAPVVDEDRTFLGQFSQQGCMIALVDIVYHQVPIPVFVRDYLEAETRTVTEDTGLLTIASIFAESERLLLSLPVLRKGKVIGLVARLDVIRAILKFVSLFPEPKAATLYISALIESEKDRPKLD